MEYICKETFYIDEYDDDGLPTDNCLTVEKGSVWTVDDDSWRLLAGEYRLLNGDQWIEISSETLNTYFKIR